MPNTSTAAWPTLTAGKVAKASDVEAKFDFAETNLWPHSGGTKMNNTYDLGDSTSAYWRTAWVYSLNATTSAQGIAVGTTTVANNSDVALEIAGTRAILIPRVTTAQRTALTGIGGMMVYDSTLNAFRIYQNGSWVPAGGTVYKNMGVTIVQVSAASTTILSVASGGGKIHGISWKAGNAGGTVADIAFKLDGATVYNTTSASFTTTSGDGYIDAAGNAIIYSTTALATTTVFQTKFVIAAANNVPVPGSFDFASTAALYMGSSGGVTTTVAIVHSVIQ